MNAKPKDGRVNNGGARDGAGRKEKPANERRVTASVSMLPAEWARLDAARGPMARGKYIASRLP